MRNMKYKVRNRSALWEIRSKNVGNTDSRNATESRASGGCWLVAAPWLDSQVHFPPHTYTGQPLQHTEYKIQEKIQNIKIPNSYSSFGNSKISITHPDEIPNIMQQNTNMKLKNVIPKPFHPTSWQHQNYLKQTSFRDTHSSTTAAFKSGTQSDKAQLA